MSSLLGAILRQILSQLPTVPAPIAELVRTSCHKRRRTVASTDDIFHVLRLLQPPLKRLFICVDALDEYDDSESFLAACSRFPSIASFFFIGRRSIAQAVRSAFHKTIVHIVEPQNEDIGAFLSSWLENERHSQPDLIPPNLCSDAENTILR